jgi:hypothetical protein
VAANSGLVVRKKRKVLSPRRELSPASLKPLVQQRGEKQKELADQGLACRVLQALALKQDYFEYDLYFP